MRIEDNIIFNVRRTVKAYIDGEIDRSVLVKRLYGCQGADHGTEHIFAVLKKGEYIHRHKLSKTHVLALVLHDIGNRVDRDTHEVVGSEIAKIVLEGLLDSETIKIISDAILTHRASCKAPLVTYMQELVSSADRHIESGAMIIYRSYVYATNKCNFDHDEAIRQSLEHIKKKYATGGYARYPELFKKNFPDEIERVNKFADELTEEKIRYSISIEAHKL